MEPEEPEEPEEPKPAALVCDDEDGYYSRPRFETPKKKSGQQANTVTAEVSSKLTRIEEGYVDVNSPSAEESPDGYVDISKYADRKVLTTSLDAAYVQC